MTASAPLDLSTLALIRTEVERSLEEADATLARATSDAPDGEALSKARRLLAGVPEALELAGVRGLPTVLHAIDALLAELQTEDVRAAGENVSLCRLLRSTASCCAPAVTIGCQSWTCSSRTSIESSTTRCRAPTCSEPSTCAPRSPPIACAIKRRC
jgi:hypothetical protein